VWPYWIARPRTWSIGAQLGLGIVALLYSIRLAQFVSHHRSIDGVVPVLLALLGSQAFLYFGKLYDLALDSDWRLFVAKVLQSVAAVIALVLAVAVAYPRFSPKDNATLVVLLLSALLLVVLRPLVHWLVRNRRIGEGVLIVGTGDIGQKLYDELSRRNHAPATKAFDRGADPASVGFVATPLASCSIHCDELSSVIQTAGISRIILAEPDPEKRRVLGAILFGCKLRGVTIEEAIDFYERLNRKIWIEGIHSEWLIYSDGFCPSKLYMGIKRAADLLGAIVLILVASPVLVLIAVAIRLDSPGPVFFTQERVGLDGRRFTVIKYRSMKQDAEASTGPTWATADDDRITRVGRILRKFRLDEIPQAFNVLRGDMSFVGPRPERPFFVDQLREQVPYYNLRHHVKPGITGWAQVTYPYGSSIEDAYEKLQYDFYYAKHISPRIDLLILLKTLKVVLFGKGQ
jgi:sugar transferase (PEP-CTERM system associated)